MVSDSSATQPWILSCWVTCTASCGAWLGTSPRQSMVSFGIFRAEWLPPASTCQNTLGPNAAVPPYTSIATSGSHPPYQWPGIPDPMTYKCGLLGQPSGPCAVTPAQGLCLLSGFPWLVYPLHPCRAKCLVSVQRALGVLLEMTGLRPSSPVSPTKKVFRAFLRSTC